jgi:hypothetical protein
MVKIDGASSMIGKKTDLMKGIGQDGKQNEECYMNVNDSSSKNHYEEKF